MTDVDDGIWAEDRAVERGEVTDHDFDRVATVVGQESGGVHRPPSVRGSASGIRTSVASRAAPSAIAAILVMVSGEQEHCLSDEHELCDFVERGPAVADYDPSEDSNRARTGRTGCDANAAALIGGLQRIPTFAACVWRRRRCRSACTKMQEQLACDGQEQEGRGVRSDQHNALDITERLRLSSAKRGRAAEEISVLTSDERRIDRLVRTLDDR